MQKISRATLRGLAAALLLIPGLVGVLTLHPYEYIFYNSLIGGVRGIQKLRAGLLGDLVS